MSTTIRIGTRDSRLAVWQASTVQKLLAAQGRHAELVYIKSEGDIDLQTPLYEMGVQGIFTRSLDAALLNDKIDIAVHSLKDVPTRLPVGIVQAAVLKRGSWHDLLVVKKNTDFLRDDQYQAVIGTSSVRRRAQWLHRYPLHTMENLRGNMQTRLEKLHSSPWDGAIFAEAGLSRIELRPENSVVLDWMLPAPAQGAIMIAAREQDHQVLNSCRHLNDEETQQCTAIERNFLRAVFGGCSTPVSALAVVRDHKIFFQANMFSPDGKQFVKIERERMLTDSKTLGEECAETVLGEGGREINELIRQQLNKTTTT